VGYDLGGPYLGFVEQGNPIGLLRNEEGDFARTEPELERRRENIDPIRIGDMITGEQ